MNQSLTFSILVALSSLSVFGFSAEAKVNESNIDTSSLETEELLLSAEYKLDNTSGDKAKWKCYSVKGVPVCVFIP